MTMADILKVYTECINFAALKHRNQKRKDDEKTPYINHPIGVAYILTSEGNITDFEVLQAAILHDTVEDTDTTFDEIETYFGKNVRQIVEELTDDKTLEKSERKRLQIEHGLHSSYKAKLIKLADKLYNLRDLKKCRPYNWTEERRQEYYRWAKLVVDNIRGTNQMLEAALDVIFQAEGIL